MMQKSPELMQEIIEFTDQFYARNGRTPSCREIEKGTTMKRSSIHNYLVAMDERGLIEYNGRIIVTPKIRETRQGVRQVGIVGSIACGTPIDEVEELEGTFPVPLGLVDGAEMYILHASGQSMIDIGIQDGDMVLVRKQEEAHPGDIVVAYVEGVGNTLKRLLYKDGEMVLHPENREMADMPARDCRIQGVAVWVFKKIGQ